MLHCGSCPPRETHAGPGRIPTRLREFCLNIFAGAIYVTIAGLFFAGMSAGVKALSADLPSEAIVFFRNALALLILVPWLGSNRPNKLQTRVFHLHFIRAATGLAAMYCFFYALGKISLANAVLLNYTMPLFLPIIAWIWLKEIPPPKVWGAVLLGFSGVALILKPTTEMFDAVALVGLTSGLLGAIAQVSIRKMTRTEPVTRVVFYFAFLSTLVSAVPMLHLRVSIGWKTALLLAFVAGVATIAQFLLTKGYGTAPAARVGPFIYSCVVFAALIDWVLWSHTLDMLSMLGSCLVVIGGVLAILASRKSSLAPGAIPK